MYIVRQTSVNPQPGRKERVEEILDALEAHYATLPGYGLGFRYKLVGGTSGEIGRIAVWRSHENADHAAQNTHSQALRSELNLVITEEHQEHMWEIEGTPQNLPEA